MPKLPLDSSCQAEYEDGYIHDETTLHDTSPYGPFFQDVPVLDENQQETGEFRQEQYDKNVLNDIIEKRPEAEHGRMVRFSVFWKNTRYDIDWRNMPDNARPIRFKDVFATFSGTTKIAGGVIGVRFGYQYTNELGRNQQEVYELR